MTERNGIVCIIPARGGSKGILNKNVVELEGRPLLSWSIVGAKASMCIERVIVSTDNGEIAAVARQWGAEVPFIRPEELASDNVHAVQVVLHALKWLDQNENYLPKGVMMLLPTSPLRLTADIDGAIDLFESNNAPSVVSVVDLGKYMTNLRYIEDNRLVRVAPDEKPNAQRQGLKKLFAVNGSIFLARPSTLKSKGTFHTNEALAYVMDSLNSIDINSWEDLLLARKLASTYEPWKYWKTNNK